MYIPTYQIHNVLKVYSTQICNSGVNALAGEIKIIGKTRQQTITNKVVSNIVERLTKFGLEKKDNLILSDIIEENEKNSIIKKKSLVFKQVDENNIKSIRTLYVEKTGISIK